MNCETARALLLEAEPGALRAAPGTPLGEHLAQCEECAGLAAEIRAADAAVHGALVALSASPGSLREPRRRVWPRLAALLPLAAAAALVLVLRREPTGAPPAAPAPTVPRHTVVNGTGGSGVAVMQTRDPNITVIWNF